MFDRIEITEGDITRQDTDAIVNAANTSLLGGGGVDGAIHRAAGPSLLGACRRIGGCPPGEARITKGYGLPAEWVIHTVGPIWNGGGEGEDELLSACYRNVLQLASENGVGGVAFPSISTGAYRFPMERATRIAIATVDEELTRRAEIERVVFALFDDKSFNAFDDQLKTI